MSNVVNVFVRKKLGEVEAYSVKLDSLMWAVQRPRFANGDITEFEEVLSSSKELKRKDDALYVPCKNGSIIFDYFEHKIYEALPVNISLKKPSLKNWLNKVEDVNSADHFELVEMIRFINKVYIYRDQYPVENVKTVEDLKKLSDGLAYFKNKDISIQFSYPSWKVIPLLKFFIFDNYDTFPLDKWKIVNKEERDTWEMFLEDLMRQHAEQDVFY